ncbi:MAG TPA: AbrB/MazE/SpoVT family DNA-binding domain-containing protein [Acidimicrobiales bacterium]|nr:AbrB/MazE/SpoVT family DNA-binding domain-containing protein [Acidimicrobiales bacterium]
MARKVDDLGRIVLPVETRRLFGIRPGDALEISVVEGSIVLHKLESGCVFCDGDLAVREYKGKLVCKTCAGELGQGPSGGDAGADGAGTEAGVAGVAGAGSPDASSAMS